MANPSRRIIEAFCRSPSTQIPSKPTSHRNPYLSSYISSTIHNSYTPSPRNPLLLIRTTTNSSSSSSSIFPSGFSNTRNLLTSSGIHSRLSFHDNSSSSSSKLLSPNTLFSQILSRKLHSHTPFIGKSSHSSVGFPPSDFSNCRRLTSDKLLAFSSQRLGFNGCPPLGGYRHLSFKTSDFTTKFNGNFTKTVVDKPLSAIRSAFVRYREAVGLQIEAFWRRNYLVLLGVGAFGLCMLLWRIMFGIADTFIGFSEGMAKYGFLALSSAIVAFAGLYVRSRFTINPDKVYRIAMRRLNTSAEILEVMGAPLSGTDLRAYVMSAGGLRLKNFKPKLGGKRCFLIFPIRGSERKGLVSVEVKKKKGQYDMKLLAVDIPMTTGPDQRFFLIGDEEEYKVGGGLISELRDPIVKAMAAVKEFEALDQKEEEEDAERELEEAERKNLEEIEKLEKANTKAAASSSV